MRESEEKEKEREGRDMRGKINAMSTGDIMSWHFFTVWYNGGLERFTAKVTFSNGGMDGRMTEEKGFEMEKGGSK